MADDIIDRLRCAYSAASEPPCEECTFCAARAEIERLRALVDDYELGINWHTTCTNCAKLMDVNYDQYCEIERLRAAGDALHKALNDNIMWSGLDQINAAWEEARREQ